MSIQWFPGHMHRARQALAERLADTDVVVEMLDARLPGSSANPMLAEMAGHKPTLKVLNKQDLADSALTALWLAHYNAQPLVQAMALDAGEKAPTRRLLKACRELAPLRGGMVKPLRLVICGIPNVGKSTLINTLMGRRAAAAADEAGVTMAEQRLQLASDCYLVDTPGMLWPRIAVPQSGVLLAATGAVGRNAYDEEALAHELLPLLRVRHEAALAQRYALADAPGLSDEAMLQAIARRRGGLMSGGRLNLHKAGEALLQDLRSGALGALTLETPQEFAAWAEAAALADVEREARRAAVRELQRGAKPQRGLLAEVARELGETFSDEAALPDPATQATIKASSKAKTGAPRARFSRSRQGRPG